jgi:subtilase family serine protease
MLETDPDVPTALSLSPSVVPAGLGPADLVSAYDLPVTVGGAGETVAVVEADSDPVAESDLAVYRSQYGLPACTSGSGCFTVLSTQPWPIPETDDFDRETAADLDMVSAACPLCRILLVTAASLSTGDLLTRVSLAAAKAKFVSLSYGGPDYSGQTGDDGVFNHPGDVFTVSSADGGYSGGADYPADSQYVTAVGGTVLSRDASTARGWTESAWAGSGTGCSLFDPVPPWQSQTITGPLCSMRAASDVSAVASNLAIYDSVGGSLAGGGRWAGWTVVAGTSLSAPLIAGGYALAGGVKASDYAASYPYTRGT